LAWIWVAGLTLLYALTLRPSIGWYDTPEFVDVAYTLGIPHPPGSPAYVLLGKLATLIPLGGIAVRMNLLSALCAVLALVLLARCVADLHGRLDGRGSSGWLGGVLAATGLAVAPTYWAYATQSEAYAPFALFVALLLFLALRWDRTRDERYLLSGAFVFGLSGGIHGTSLFFAPALAFFVLTGLPRDRWAGTLLRAAFFGILGASVYLYLPLRAGAEPPINWGHPDTWSRFWIHVSDRKDAAYHFPVASKPWWPYIRQFALNLNAELTPAGWLAGLGGLGVLLWRSWRVGIFTLLFCLGNLLFFIQIWTIPDGFMPTFFLVTFWGGMALACLLEARRVALRAAAGALCLTFLVFVGVQAHDGSHRARARATDAARFAVAANLLPLPEDTLVFVTANWFALRYLQDVEGMRPDVTIVLPSDLTRPMHFTPITVARFPKLSVPAGKQDGEDWEEFFQQLLRENLGRMPIYWEPLAKLNQNVYAYLHPWRYLWRFDADGPTSIPPEEVESYVDDLGLYLGRALETTGALAADRPGHGRGAVAEDTETLEYHSYLLGVSADLLKLHGYPRRSVALLELAIRLTPGDATVANDLARYYSGFERWEDAERMFRRAADLATGVTTPLLNLAVMQMSLGRFDDAKGSIAEAMATHPRAPEPHYQLSLLERKRGRPEAARRSLERAISLSSDADQVGPWRAELETLPGGPETGAGGNDPRASLSVGG
jgi:tetratricopeptide (TPR) repeat protein